MSIFHTLSSSNYGFFFLNILIIVILYFRIEDPAVFFLIGGGMITFAFFLRRAICQLAGFENLNRGKEDES